MSKGPARRPAQPRTESTRGSFVGREGVLIRLREALDDAASGRGRLVLLSGEPGIGKTRTAEELAAAAEEQGARVLWGRCYEGDGAPAFWPWVEVLRAGMQVVGPDELRTAVGGAAELVQLVPALRQRMPNLPQPMASESPEARFRLFDAVAIFLGGLAHFAPLLVILDDLQGADRSSLLLLEFVTRALRQMRVLLLGTYRNVEIRSDHGLGESLVELDRESGTRRLELCGLNREEVGKFVRARTGAAPPDALVTELHERTEGNPLFVSEFVRVLAAERGLAEQPAELAIPLSVRAVIERRLAPLSEPCRATLRAAAVIGREFSGRLVAAVMKLASPSEHPVENALEEAAANGITGRSPMAMGNFRFAHALIRETLYDTLRSSERIRLHRWVGEAIESLPDAGERLAELAYHFSETARTGRLAGVPQEDGSDTTKAIQYARRAASRAMTLQAFEEAVRLYRLALAETEQSFDVTDADVCTLLVDLGIAENAAADLEASKATLLRAAELAMRTGSAEHLGRIALHFGSKYLWGESPAADPTLLQLLDTALQAFEGTHNAMHARLLARLAIALLFSDQHARRVGVSDQALAIARRLDDPAVVASALSAWHIAQWTPDNLPQRLEVSTELAKLAERVGDTELAFQGRAFRFDNLMELGNRLAADSELALLDRMAGQLRQPLYRWLSQLFAAVPAMLEGRFAEAERLMQECLANEAAIRGARDLVAAQMFTLSCTQLRREAFEAMLHTMGTLAAQFPDFIILRSAVAYCTSQLDQESQTRKEFDRLAANDFADLPGNHMRLLLLHQLTEVCVYLHDARRAERLAALLLPYESRALILVSGGGYLGPVSHYLGLLDCTRERWDEASRHFEQAIEMNRQMRARPWLARTQYEYARMLLMRADTSGEAYALALADEARAAAQEMNMALLLERLDALRSETRGSTSAPHDRAGALHANRGPETSVFRREGHFWTVAYADQTVRLKDSKGVQYLAHLLQNPGRELLALDLIQGADVRARGDMDNPQAATRDAGLDLIDAQAKSEYRRRLQELRAELDEAEQFNDLGRVEKLKEEIDFVARQLNAAVGLGGRDRKAGAAGERARLMVTKRIKSVLKVLDTLHPPLAHHLRACVKTGYYCAYMPPPGEAVVWMT